MEKGDLLVTAASNVPGPAPQVAGLPKWRKKKMIELALAKLTALSLAAKVGAATGAEFGAGVADDAKSRRSWGRRCRPRRRREQRRPHCRPWLRPGAMARPGHRGGWSSPNTCSCTLGVHDG